jgi:hypothetical protein
LVADAIHGVQGALISDALPIVTPDARKIISFLPIHLTQLGAFAKGQPVADIRGIILQMTDLTEQRFRVDAIENEMSQVRAILETGFPTPIVKQLAAGTESVAFAVQSATIGCFRVISEERDVTVEDPFEGVHKLFLLSDKLIATFQELTKTRLLANGYVYAGGVFRAINRPEKHTEEAVRFALKILKSREEVYPVLPPGAQLLIGLNTGEPLIGGVMSAERPGFQLLGVPVELTRILALAGQARELHVTRSVYQLVYEHHFKVTDRGDLPLRGGKSVHTSVITA